MYHRGEAASRNTRESFYNRAFYSKAMQRPDIIPQRAPATKAAGTALNVRPDA